MPRSGEGSSAAIVVRLISDEAALVDRGVDDRRLHASADVILLTIFDLREDSRWHPTRVAAAAGRPRPALRTPRLPAETVSRFKKTIPQIRVQ